jgi:hypothetical protein
MRIAPLFAAIGLLGFVAVYVLADSEVQPERAPSENAQPEQPQSRPPARLPDSFRVERVADVATLSTSSEQRFVVACLLRVDEPPAESRGPDTKVTVISKVPCPAFTVRDGERAKVADTSVERFAVADVKEAGTTTPIVREASIGMTFAATVVDLGDDAVLLDLSAHWCGKCALPPMDKNAVKIVGNEGRIIQKTKLGEPIVADFGTWSIEATVRNAGDE